MHHVINGQVLFTVLCPKACLQIISRKSVIHRIFRLSNNIYFFQIFKMKEYIFAFISNIYRTMLT